MPYPLDTITPTTTDEEKQQAFLATVQQMMQEGANQDEAQAAASRLLSEKTNAPLEFDQKQSTDYGSSMMNPNSAFARGGGSGRSSSSNRFESVPNVRLSNFNPAMQGDGRIHNR